MTFDWSHEYGPLDWPREGTTLLNVKSDRPHYWKAETLDAFDGFRWYPLGDSDQARDSEPRSPSTASRQTAPSWDYGEYNRRLGRDDRLHGPLAVDAASWSAPA